ncbi:MAG: hypothetical protein JXQ73_14325 [Phycisphaerae bacterium]|nr:hypothetical protein [Phycisphaerae bacterium]
MAIDPRNERYRETILTAPYEICVERARYVTQSYRATEGEHPALRAAKALAHTLASMSLHVLDGERIVGNRSSKLLGAVIPVERGDINTVLELEFGMAPAPDRKPFLISVDERRELLQEILPYWRGKTVRDRKKALWRANGLFLRPARNPWSWIKRARGLNLLKIHEVLKAPRLNLEYIFRGLDEVLYNNPAFVMNVFDVQGHLILGHKNILRDGFTGVRSQAIERLDQARRERDADGQAFLEAVVLSCDAIHEFAARIADEADRLAGRTHDAARQQELREIAARCRHVPFHPPRDFREAVQALWLTQVGAVVAYGMSGIFAVGRLDQHLYPFYARDKADGQITDAEAVAWLEELLIKLSSNLLLLPTVGKRTSSELGSDSAAPTVGGLTPEGGDAVNDLSYLLLEAFTNVKSLGNSFTIRLSRQSPDAFWHKALETYRHTSGAALFCDEVTIGALKTCGMTERDARDYGAVGCVEPTGDGDTFGCTSGNDISLTGALEMTLSDGRLRIMGRRVGPRTGDPRRFPTFAAFMAAFKQQVTFMVDFVVRATNLKDRVYIEGFPNPYVSATLAGCVAGARDMTAGGAAYNYGSISARGLGTVADSLAAVRHLVYETRQIPMDRLIRALATDFRGAEDLRRRLVREGPKYGCDDDRADAIAKDVAEFFCHEVAKHKTIRGGPYRPSFFSYGMHVLEGLFLGATPDGRHAGEPVSNSFSPANGSERKGPTAMLRSVAKINHALISNGCAVNMKLMPSMFDDVGSIDKAVALVRSYFAMGGMEVQFNVVSNKTLRDAQQHPEQHRGLVVRVSGYSAYFTDLGKPLQDEIIKRTAFDGM